MSPRKPRKLAKWEQFREERRKQAVRYHTIRADDGAARCAETLLRAVDFLATEVEDNPGKPIILPTKTAKRLAEVMAGVAFVLLADEAQYTEPVQFLGRRISERFARWEHPAERDDA